MQETHRDVSICRTPSAIDATVDFLSTWQELTQSARLLQTIAITSISTTSIPTSVLLATLNMGVRATGFS